jgi:hypothetical protein
MVPNWFLTSKYFYRSPFSKWPPQYHTNSTLSDFNDISYVIIIYPHMKCHWNRTMLNLCGIVAAILKMATDKNLSMSGIISRHHIPFSKWPPQYRTNSTLFDFNVLNWFPTLKHFYRSLFSKWSPQYRKNSTLFDFKVAFDLFFKPVVSGRYRRLGINLGHHYLPTYQILMISENVEFLWPFWKWRPLEIFQCRE